MDKKICLITGANAGIGKAAAVQLAAQGCHVVMVCRDSERGQQALEDVRKAGGNGSAELMIADMSLQSSIRELAEAYPYDKLDVLISNAAAFDLAQKLPQKTAEGIESVWATNHIGPVLLVDLFLERLKSSGQGRILTVASQGLVMHPGLKIRFDDPEFEKGGFSVAKAYYHSKLAQVMYTFWLANELSGTGVTANCIRVTNVKVDVSRYPGLSRLAKFAYSIKSKKSISPEEMAKTYVYLALSEDVDGVTGRYYDHHQKPVEPSAYSCDKTEAAKLMELTRTYIRQ